MIVQQFCWVGFFDVVWVIGMMVVMFVVVFVVGEDNFFGVDDNNVVVSVDMWGEIWVVFVVKMYGDERCQVVNNSVFCVDYNLFVFDFCWFCGVSFYFNFVLDLELWCEFECVIYV